MSAIESFVFKGCNVRTISDENGDPWFILADVCKILELGNPSQVKTRLHNNDVQVIDLYALTSNEGRKNKDLANVINESGLYDLIFDSRKPEAKAFRHWVTSEVLPSIRKTGSYSMKPKTALELAREQVELLERLEEAHLKIEQDKPKVKFAEIVSDSSNTRCIRVWVKAMKHENNLKVGERDVFKWLVDNKFIFREAHGYLPYARYESNGLNYFTVVIEDINDKPRRMLKITGRGVVALTGKVVSHFNNNAAPACASG